MESKRQLILDKIASVKVPKEYETLDIGYIPLGRGLVMKKEVKKDSGLVSTAGGILMTARKSQFESQARIVALGPDCSDYLKVGLMVNYNSMADIETIIHGDPYVISNEVSVEGIIVDLDNVKLQNNIESVETINRRKRQERMVSGVSEIRKQGENDLDAVLEKSKDRNKNPNSKKYR